MLCWANENWARNWAGGFNDVLIAQNYSDEDDIDHMRYLCSKVFSDKRYIRIDNKPVFAIYRPLLFPDMNKTIATWRRLSLALSLIRTMKELLMAAQKRCADALSSLRSAFTISDGEPLEWTDIEHVPQSRYSTNICSRLIAGVLRSE